MCVTYTDLGSEKHTTQAEVNDAIKICDDAMAVHKTKIASISVDNAARAVAGKVATHYKDDMYIIVSRDPSHCIDLLSKDLASTNLMKKLLDEADEVHKFVRIDRVDSIRRETAEEGDLNESYAGMTKCDTRMNLSHDFILGALKQATFLAGLPRNQKWKDYLDDRKPNDRAKSEQTLKKCSDDSRQVCLSFLFNVSQ